MTTSWLETSRQGHSSYLLRDKVPVPFAFLMSFAQPRLPLDDLAAVFVAEPDVETTIPTIPLEVVRFEFDSAYYSQPQGRRTC